jgi:hypothetical protein
LLRPAGPPITIRFPGFTSRWTIPCRCAYSRPAHAWAPISTAASGASLGYVLAELGRLPEIGDEIVVEGRTLTVIELDGRRIARLRVGAPPEPQPTEDAETDATAS